jgi:hypothetical protein
VKWAKDNQASYELYLKWSSIRANVIENGFATEDDMRRIDVHYRFLSSYVHPISDRQEATYGRNQGWPRYDHYASELVLLYIITFAVREIRAFLAMCKLDPAAGIAQEAALVAECDRLWRAAGHLWFPGQPRHAYEDYLAANRAVFEHMSPDRVPPVDRDGLYYSDPLGRLVALHQSCHEMLTGIVYQSPWERHDARWR